MSLGEMTVNRVAYGKKDTSLTDREFEVTIGGPVGNVYDYHKNVLPRLKAIDKIVFLDHLEPEVITLYKKGYVTIQSKGSLIIETTIEKLYGSGK